MEPSRKGCAMSGGGADSEFVEKKPAWRQLQKGLDYFDVDVSTAVLAQILGRSDRWVRELAERGIADKVSYGRFGLLKTLRAYIDSLSETASGRGGNGAGGGGSDAEDDNSEDAKLKRERRINWELKNRQMAGDLVDAAEVERAWADELSNIRTRMLAVTGRIATSAPHLSKADMACIDREIRKALAAAAEGKEPDAPAGR